MATITTTTAADRVNTDVNTVITAKHVESVLANAGLFDVYVMHNVETGELDVEQVPSGIKTVWVDEWKELLCVRSHEIGSASRAGRNAKAAIRKLLENH